MYRESGGWCVYRSKYLCVCISMLNHIYMYIDVPRIGRMVCL